MKNPYEKMSDKELSGIIKDVIEAKEQGHRAESLVPYAKEIFENLNLDVNKPTIMLNECLNMAYYDLTMTVMKKYVIMVENNELTRKTN